MELETLIRETLREHAADAPTLLPLIAARPPRRWLYAGLAAALVAGLAVGAVALRSARSHPPNATTIPAAPHVPAGYKPISYHGITLAVPAELPVLPTSCGTGDGHYVLAEAGGDSLCPAVRADAEITLQPEPTPFRSEVLLPHLHRVTIDGKVALLSADNASDETGPLPSTGRLFFRDPGIDVTIYSDWATVQTVLNSVHVTPTNWQGCPDRNPTADPRRGSDLVPSRPSSASVCTYSAGGSATSTSWQVASRVLSSSERSALVGYVDRLPRHPLSSGAFPAQNQTVLVVFRYSDGSSYRLAAGRYLNGSWFVANGSEYADDAGGLTGRLADWLGTVR